MFLALLCGCIIIECPEMHTIHRFSEYIKQPDGITCGPACVDMVLRFYGKKVSFRQIEDDVLTSAQYRGERLGFSTPNGVASGLRRNGVTCKVTRGSIDYLKRQISTDTPVIVLLRSGSDMWHWVVVMGYTREGFWFADPFTGRREWISNTNMDSSWCFKSDMDGDMVAKRCFWCHGSGIKFYLPCDICLGSGVIDNYKAALRTAGIHSYTIVVPTKASR